MHMSLSSKTHNTETMWRPDQARSAYACIDPGAVSHNLQVIRRQMHTGANRHTPFIWAVVKADAYGHGLEHVLPALQATDGLAVLSADDAYRCRLLGWTKPLLVLCGQISRDELQDPVLHPLHIVVEHAGQLEQLEQLAGGALPHIWLRYAGTLHHAGFAAEDYRPAYARLHAMWRAGRLPGIGHFQHYAGAEDAEQWAAERAGFLQLTAGLLGRLCTENSAALLGNPAAAATTDGLRIGIALYGVSPLSGSTGSDLGLKPAMTLRAPIFGVQELNCGDGVGYNSVFRADRALRIGLVRCGYADGYPRTLHTGCPVQVGGRISRIVGRVSMDTLTIDLSDRPDVGPGDIVTLWGAPGLPVEDIARAAGTIAAQLLTGITGRVPRLLAGAT